jgi:hypothetical protein
VKKCGTRVDVWMVGWAKAVLRIAYNKKLYLSSRFSARSLTGVEYGSRNKKFYYG